MSALFAAFVFIVVAVAGICEGFLALGLDWCLADGVDDARA